MVCLFFMIQPTIAQIEENSFLGGFGAGAVLSEVSGDHASGPDKPGLFVTLFVTYPITDYRSLSLELMYMQKGSRAFNDPAVSGGGSYRDYKLNLHYIEIPVVLVWHPAGFAGNAYLNRLYFETGLSPATMLSHYEEDLGLDITERESGSRPFYPVEINLIAGLNYKAGEKWHVSFRLNQGLIPFRKHGTSGGDNRYWWNWHNQFGQYHTAWSLGLRYHFSPGFADRH